MLRAQALLPLVLLLALPVLAHGAVETPMPDPALEKRLTIERFYRTKRGDSLRSVARLLFGHETWWPKLVELNPGMKGMNADWRMPENTRVKYLAAEVGETYIVQNGDWLIRIANWKYGDTAHWERILGDNPSAITNPNLIHPGDRLVFRADGTIENTTTRQTILSGLPASPPAPEADREPAAVNRPAEETAYLGLPAYFWWGTAAGLLLLALGLPKRSRAVAAARTSGSTSLRLDDSAPALSGSLAGPELEDDPSPAEFDELYQAMTRDGYLRTFKRRPPEEYRVDTTLVPYENGLPANPSGYHSIVPKKLKKYLKLKKKK
jgi:hypothetical protein